MPTLSKLTKTAFHSEAAAFEYLEATLWPEGAVCPHCGTVGNATKLQTTGEPVNGKRQARIGLWKCKEKECRKQFTVKVGTVFEHGRIPLHKMLQAVYLLCCSKKGISSHQLHRVLEITYKAAWFLLASHPRSHAGRLVLTPDGRRWRDCRDRRNLRSIGRAKRACTRDTAASSHKQHGVDAG